MPKSNLDFARVRLNVTLFLIISTHHRRIFSDVRDGALISLIANLMQQLLIDQAADVYDQARKIHDACSAFQNEVWQRHSPLSLVAPFD